MSWWDELKASADDRLELDLLPALYAAASLDTADIRQELREASVPFVEPLSGARPTLEELTLAGDSLIEIARREATVIGGAGGMAGAIGVPPEALASLVHVLRLGQRLCVLFGFDPDEAEGYVMMWRVVGAAYKVKLPEEVELKIRDLPAAAAMQLPEVREAARWMARRVLNRALWSVVGKGIRWIPGAATGLSAFSANRRVRAQGRRMKMLLLQDAKERTPKRLPGPGIEEAEVVQAGDPEAR